MVSGIQAGIDLVKADGIRAVGFTGSQNGGLSLWKIANEREIVIPVYAEMGTVNPVVLTARGVAHLDEVAKGFVGSFTLRNGQFCSKPGLLFAPAGSNAAQAVASALEAASLQPRMLTKVIAENVDRGMARFTDAGATIVTRVDGGNEGWAADSAVLSTPISALVKGSALLEECFGPVALVTEYSDPLELEAGLHVLQGSLAGAVFGDGEDDPEVGAAVAALEGQVGRVTVGDWPTGVAWAWAQQHGGPWPATSNPGTTSVGGAALERFVRPVTFQSVPDSALPADVRPMVAKDNPLHIPRRIDGTLVPA
jgi:NADP-dependent aldehyde dehydrogenase